MLPLKGPNFSAIGGLLDRTGLSQSAALFQLPSPPLPSSLTSFLSLPLSFLSLLLPIPPLLILSIPLSFHPLPHEAALLKPAKGSGERCSVSPLQRGSGAAPAAVAF